MNKSEAEVYVQLKYGTPQPDPRHPDRKPRAQDTLEWCQRLPVEVVDTVYKHMSDTFTGPGTLYPDKWKQMEFGTQCIRLSYTTVYAQQAIDLLYKELIKYYSAEEHSVYYIQEPLV